MIDVQGVGKARRLRRVCEIAPMRTPRAAEKLERKARAELMQAHDRSVPALPEAPRFAGRR